MLKKWHLLISSLLILWLAISLIRVENQRYAMQVGMCKSEPVGWDYKCLAKVETRTSAIWHLYYGLLGS